MSTQVKEIKNVVVLENDYVTLEIDKKDASVLSIKDVKTGKSIKGDDCIFFYAADREEKQYGAKITSFKNGVATFETELGTADVKFEAFDDHFIFEVIGAELKKEVFYICFAGAKFDYDTDDTNVFRWAEIPMTVNTRTFYYPDGLSKDFRATAYPHLGGVKGAKVGVATVPETLLRETLKTISLKIDKNKGIVSKSAGAFARDNQLSFGDYTVVYDTEPELVKNTVEFYKSIGVDQIDYHQGHGTYRQGDFKYMRVKDHDEFREKVVGVLKEHGMDAGLHTYAYYINPKCHEILSDPKWQEQLDRSESFTLAEDISAEDMFIPTVESTAHLSNYYGFFVSNLPYVLIGNELIRFSNDDKGFKVSERGASGTNAIAHKKGEKIVHMRGCFNFFSPAVGTDLFKKIAHNTADTYNKGGFAMIYLDALDGVTRHCDIEHECWYYAAVFVHEIVKNCDTDPIIEYSTMYPSIWAARARMNAWDTPFRAYKTWNKIHDADNQLYMRCHYACTLGWYDYYPLTEQYPGNQHTKYHHLDAIDHMGALAVINDYSTVFNPATPALVERYAGFRRNLKRYKFYSDIRKAKYFSPEVLEKAKQNPHEMHIIEKKKGKYVFVEKDYQTKRLYDIMDPERNTAEFTNPFKAQTPFVRIEANMSTYGNDPFTLLPLDDNKPVAAQVKRLDFNTEIDMTKHLAMTVRVKGNGKKGAIGIKLRCASQSEHGYGLYIVETNFKGYRDFVLLEADNGDRPDLPFDNGMRKYPTYRTGLNMNRITSIELEVAGDVEGVTMSSVKACPHVYNVIKNPTVKLGDELVMFECELMSTDFIEWDGKTAKVIDRYGNEKTIWFTGSLNLAKGKNKVSFVATSALNNCPVNVYLTLGFTGKEIK